MTNDKNYTEQAEQEGRQGVGVDGWKRTRQTNYVYVYIGNVHCLSREVTFFNYHYQMKKSFLIVIVFIFMKVRCNILRKKKLI